MTTRNTLSSFKPTVSGRAALDFSPLPAAVHPILTRLQFFLSLWSIKVVVSIAIRIINLIYGAQRPQPSLTKSYTCRPSLQIRIFLPDNGQTAAADPKPTASTRRFPLYIDIHGGGFAIGDASIDDQFSRSWSRRTNSIVASVNYHKSPLHPFPAAVYDIAALADAIISDSSLPIDTSRVTIGGFSAGGNLALTACLAAPHLLPRIHAVIAYYPIVDWSSFPHVKFANRLFTDKPSDTIATAGPILDWGYVPAGQNRKDKRLSPCYASPDELPPNICIVAAQHDMLCREARDMMHSLIDSEVPATGWEQGFERGGYKWVMVPGVKHGFADEVVPLRGKRGERRKKLTGEVYGDVAKWLEGRGII